jgi:chlorite dismutase
MHRLRRFAVAPATVLVTLARPWEATRADVDKGKMLTEAGVTGVFVTYKCHGGAKQQSTSFEREHAKQELKRVVQAHSNSVLVETYLTRGFAAGSDVLLRLHTKEPAAAQRFVLDFAKTALGQRMEPTETLVGVTKGLNYITKDQSGDLNAALFQTPYSKGPPKYSVVVPIKKSAAWWNLSQEKRRALLEEHTRVTLEYLPSVKRKLYHSTGLCDADFITYFETEDLGTFNALMIALARVEENTYHVRWGNPTIVATFATPDMLVEELMV